MGPRKLRENEHGDEILDSEELFNGPGKLGLSPRMQEIKDEVVAEVRNTDGIDLVELEEDGE